jgi:hypothetical protein
MTKMIKCNLLTNLKIGVKNKIELLFLYLFFLNYLIMDSITTAINKAIIDYTNNLISNGYLTCSLDQAITLFDSKPIKSKPTSKSVSKKKIMILLNLYLCGLPIILILVLL